MGYGCRCSLCTNHRASRLAPLPHQPKSLIYSLSPLFQLHLAIYFKKSNMTAKELHSILSKGENISLECKKAEGGLPNSLWETYSSFANTDGGYIFLGIEEQDNHQFVITGVKDTHKMASDFWNMVNNRQKVNINILTDRMVNVCDVEGKNVLAIEVPRADRRHRPVYVGVDPMKGTYRRDFEGDYLCTPDQVAALYRDASNVSVDQRVLNNMTIDVLDKETVSRYRNRFHQFHSAHAWNDDDDELFLRHIGAMALSNDDMKFHPTAAGLLMFGREYDIVREFPHYFLDYQERLSVETRWTHRIVSSSGDWSGNLYDFFFRVYPRVTSDLPVPFVTNGKDREDDTKLHLSIREVLLNCLAHADHYERQGIVVIKTDDSLSFSNPGDIRIGLKVALQGGVSDPRNETIMKMFSLVDVGERAGSGIPDLMATWVKYVKAIPKFNIKQNPARTETTLPYTIKALQEAGKLLSGEKGGRFRQGGGLQGGLPIGEGGLQGGLLGERSGLSTTAQAILKLLDENPSMTYDEISKRLGKARSGIAKHIKNLRKKGFIK